MRRTISVREDAYESLVHVGAALALQDGELWSMADVVAFVINNQKPTEFDIPDVVLVRPGKKS